MQVKALGDQAVMLYFDAEEAAFSVAEEARRTNWPWLIDVVQAYRSVAVFYDAIQIDFDSAAEAVRQLSHSEKKRHAGRSVHIPCCYDLGLDLERVSTHTGLSREQIIELHSSTIYTVYAIGFCPGFPYLGYLPERLSGVPRLESPRLRVEAGSIGLTGRQTGIYTEARPGGWNILGRTSIELVNVADGYFPLHTGDQVRFQPISLHEYEKLRAQRLS